MNLIIIIHCYHFKKFIFCCWIGYSSPFITPPQPHDESAAWLVKIPPFWGIDKPVQGTDTNVESLISDPQTHALLDTLGIVGYGCS
jgi:hypothetical protein